MPWRIWGRHHHGSDGDNAICASRFYSCVQHLHRFFKGFGPHDVKVVSVEGSLRSDECLNGASLCQGHFPLCRPARRHRKFRCAWGCISAFDSFNSDKRLHATRKGFRKGVSLVCYAVPSGDGGRESRRGEKRREVCRVRSEDDEEEEAMPEVDELPTPRARQRVHCPREEGDCQCAEEASSEAHGSVSS